MNFSSLEFIFLFVPLFFGVYYKLPERWRNAAICIGSVIFYAAGTYKHPYFLLMLVASTVINYALGMLIDCFPRYGRHWVALGVIANIGSLFFLKYAGGSSGILLPVGLSFFAFRAVSYLVDVRKCRCPAERSPLEFAVFMCMFPCLVAGPITTYKDMRRQLCRREYSLAGFVSGARVFIIGLGCKALIANNLSALWSRVGALGYSNISSPLAWIAIIGYSLYIYFDFYGYSLMAIGTGRMLGFDIPENFRDPYLATGMADFWRRWHITLGEWFKKYIYIPLGGNCFGDGRTLLNLLAVWLFTGMWHGATFNFILWGLILFILIAGEKFLWGEQLERHPVAGHIYMAFAIPLTWSVFAITDLGRLGEFFARLFPFLPHGEVFAMSGDWIKYGLQYGIWIILGVICCTNLPKKLINKLRGTLAGDIALLVLLIVSVLLICQNSGDPFMYGNF